MIPQEAHIMQQVIFHNVTEDTPDLLVVFIRLFMQVFPNDKRYVRHIREAARAAKEGQPDKLYHLWLVQYGDDFAGFRLFNYVRKLNFGISGYIGFLPEYRGLGLGNLVQQRVLEQLRLDAAEAGQPTPIGIVGEMDRPSAATTDEERRIRRQRVEIFRRMGAVVLNIDYVEPPMIVGLGVDNPEDMQGATAEPSLLYVIPNDKTTRVEPQTMEYIVRGIYAYSYRLTEGNNPYLQRVLDSIYYPSGVDYTE
jgi:GNAT superfamily N-acetyltransferase